MPMMGGNQNRKRDQHQRRDQAAAPPFVFPLRGVFEAFDASLEPPQRLVIGTGLTGRTG
jgi:hypothetical protein